jgi:hypothetical protein
MGADLPNPEQGAQVIAWAFPENVDGPHFHIFRTILWSPSSHKTMFDTVRRTRPDIEFVDPNTLFFLLKRSLTESEADR